ncbi:MAG: hypothetical protein IPL11_18295 [Candidatus Accumulibacter sp.]|nr:hypothetical protein [Accumulibacter sp.]
MVDAIGVSTVAAEHRVAEVAPFRESDPDAAVEHVIGGVAGQTVVKPLPIRCSMLISVSGSGTASGLPRRWRG